MPYEFGAVADLFPPAAKKYVAGAAAIATVILRLIKRVQTPEPVAAVVVPVAPVIGKPVEPPGNDS